VLKNDTDNAAISIDALVSFSNMMLANENLQDKYTIVEKERKVLPKRQDRMKTQALEKGDQMKEKGRGNIGTQYYAYPSY
jgi:hypothetical protein